MKRGKRTDEIYGSYLLPHAMNRGKEEKVLQVLRQYRRAAEGIQRLHLRRFFEEGDRKSTRLNSSHIQKSRMPSSA